MFSLVIHYYNNRKAVARQMSCLKRFSMDTFSLFRIILIDDCSSELADGAILADLETPPLDRLRIRLFRILDPIPWNQSGARNLGCYVAPDEWLFCTDVDHFVTEEAVWKLAKWVDDGPDPDTAYKVSRVRLHDGAEIRPHANSYLVNRTSFVETGGYDEDFARGYGHSDKMFFQTWKKTGRVVTRLNDVTIAVDPSAGTRSLDREPTRNRELYRGKLSGTIPPNERRLNFAWRVVLRRDDVDQ